MNLFLNARHLHNCPSPRIAALKPLLFRQFTCPFKGKKWKDYHYDNSLCSLQIGCLPYNPIKYHAKRKDSYELVTKIYLSHSEPQIVEGGINRDLESGLLRKLRPPKTKT